MQEEEEEGVVLLIKKKRRWAGNRRTTAVRTVGRDGSRYGPPCGAMLRAEK
jgi:hypothetical protein